MSVQVSGKNRGLTPETRHLTPIVFNVEILKSAGVGAVGFFRQQEEHLAMRFIAWRYQKLGKPLPGETELRTQASQIVSDAHRIARERGRNVVAIIKDLVNDIKK